MSAPARLSQGRYGGPDQKDEVRELWRPRPLGREMPQALQVQIRSTCGGTTQFDGHEGILEYVDQLHVREQRRRSFLPSRRDSRRRRVPGDRVVLLSGSVGGFDSSREGEAVLKSAERAGSWIGRRRGRAVSDKQDRPRHLQKAFRDRVHLVREDWSSWSSMNTGPHCSPPSSRS
eukprot:8511499-Pyramimonas_sp.AAC.1